MASVSFIFCLMIFLLLVLGNLQILVVSLVFDLVALLVRLCSSTSLAF